MSMASILKSTPKTSTSSSTACASSAPPSAASTSRTSRRPSASSSSSRLRELHGHPGLPRRPARHRHHRRGRAAQRPRLTGREHQGHPDGGQRRRRRRRSPASSWSSAWACRHDNVILCDTKGVIYQGREEGMNQWKSAHAVETEARTLDEAMEGADVFFGLSVKGAVTPGHGQVHGQEADHLRHGQPRPGDHAGGRARGARRRDHRHRPLRLSQPGQQRAGLPLHLPRRARRAGARPSTTR